MKKLISVMLVLAMVFALCACGGEDVPVTQEQVEEVVEAVEEVVEEVKEAVEEAVEDAE